MKRSASLFLAALMVVCMTTLAACGESDTTTTGAPANSGSNSASVGASSDNTPSSSTNTPEGSTPVASESNNGTTPGDTLPPPIQYEPRVLVAADGKYHYQVFECIYDGSGAGGTYITDDLDDYMATFGWTLGDATIPEDALADIFSWDEANGPFGTENGVVGWDNDSNELYNNFDVDWAGDNHGLIVATTFTIENLEEFKAAYEDVFITFWYDNTPSVYLNGRLIMYKNTELTGNPGDWVDSFNYVDEDDSIFDPLEGDTLMDRLVEGENTLVIVMKDAWGGRECCFELAAE